MSVYTDHVVACVPNKNWRWNHSAHLFADTVLELHAFAGKIGLKKPWFQDEGFFPHYDLTIRKHALAVSRGAVLLSREKAIEKWHEILRITQRECDHVHCELSQAGGNTVSKCQRCGAIL